MNTTAFPMSNVTASNPQISETTSVLDRLFETAIQLGTSFVESKIDTGNQVQQSQPLFFGQPQQNFNQPLTTAEGAKNQVSFSKDVLILGGAGLLVAFILLQQG